MTYKCPTCEYTSEQPGTCPTCNVEMVEKKEEAAVIPPTES